jgi:hypothetical protein
MATVPPKYPSGGQNMIRAAVMAKQLSPGAELPSKENVTDVGWNITVIARDENRVDDTYGDVNTFRTGLVLSAPQHYHLEIIEHPQLYKTGYSLAGGPIVINPGNEDELIIPLYKFRETDDIELPFVVALAVVRETEYCGMATSEPPKKANGPMPKATKGVVQTKSTGKQRSNHFM